MVLIPVQVNFKPAGDSKITAKIIKLNL